MTEAFRAQVLAEIHGRIEDLELRLNQLEQIMAAAPTEAYELQRLAAESERLGQRKQELHWRIREAESLQVGAKLFYRTVQGLVSVRPGDRFDEALSREIIIQDGVVVEVGTGAAL